MLPRYLNALGAHAEQKEKEEEAELAHLGWRVEKVEEHQSTPRTPQRCSCPEEAHRKYLWTPTVSLHKALVITIK